MTEAKPLEAKIVQKGPEKDSGKGNGYLLTITLVLLTFSYHLHPIENVILGRTGKI